MNLHPQCRSPNVILAFVRVTSCVESWLKTALLATSSAVATPTNRTAKLKELKHDHRIEDAGLALAAVRDSGQRVSFNRACWEALT
jgi:hypothetical protein